MNGDKYPKIEVVWRDAAAHHGWGTLEEKLDNASRGSNCRSVGYLVYQDERGIYVAESLADNDNVGCVSMLPWGMLLDVCALDLDQNIPIALLQQRAKESAHAKEA